MNDYKVGDIIPVVYHYDDRKRRVIRYDRAQVWLVHNGRVVLRTWKGKKQLAIGRYGDTFLTFQEAQTYGMRLLESAVMKHRSLAEKQAEYFRKLMQQQPE